MKPKILSDEEKLGCSLISKYPYKEVKDVIIEACLHQLDADVAYYEPLIQQARQEGRDSTIEAVNKILSPIKLHLCWITEDGNPEPLSYGLADEYGDEIDVANLQMDRSSQLLKEIEKIGWHGKSEYPCHQDPYFGILEDVWQSFKSKWRKK